MRTMKADGVPSSLGLTEQNVCIQAIYSHHLHKCCTVRVWMGCRITKYLAFEHSCAATAAAVADANDNFQHTRNSILN